MWDLRTMQKNNEEHEARAFGKYVPFTHLEVEVALGVLTTIANPGPNLRSLIKKFERIREIQTEMHKKNEAHRAEANR